MSQAYWTQHDNQMAILREAHSPQDAACQAAKERADDHEWVKEAMVGGAYLEICVWQADDRRDRAYYHVAIDQIVYAAEQVDAPDQGTEIADHADRS